MKKDLEPQRTLRKRRGPQRGLCASLRTSAVSAVNPVVGRERKPGFARFSWFLGAPGRHEDLVPVTDLGLRTRARARNQKNRCFPGIATSGMAISPNSTFGGVRSIFELNAASHSI